MDSIKSIAVVAILLGVLYGIYQVINDEDSPVSPNSTNLMAEFDQQPAMTMDKDGVESGTPGDDSIATDESVDAPPSDGSGRTIAGVKPPPSTFVPETSKFSYPEKEDAPPTNGKTPPSMKAESDRAPRPSAFPSNDKKENTFPNNNSFPGNAPKSAPPKLPAGDSLAFREIGKGQVTKSDAANGNSFERTSDADGVYRTANGDPSRNSSVSATAELDINDPTNRFIEGSFADFEKSVKGDMQQAEVLIRKEDFVGALRLLSKFYDDPRLTRQENQNLASWLDPLAGKVIYSEEPHLVEAYYVRPKDTLQLLSGKFHVPAELIYNINRNVISDPQNLKAGTELKMVKGPFNAEISLSKRKMTLFVQGLYAGTFNLRIGNEPLPRLGKYRVLSKSRLGQDYTRGSTERIPALAPNNPYGQHYLNIGGEMAIHGSAEVSDSNDRRGCISLNAVDATDVHNILTTESTIVIVE